MTYINIKALETMGYHILHETKTKLWKYTEHHGRDIPPSMGAKIYLAQKHNIPVQDIHFVRVSKKNWHAVRIPHVSKIAF